MGAGRALVTVRAGITYINDEKIAQRFIDLLAQHTSSSQEGDDIAEDLVFDFKRRMRAVGGELASQMAMTVGTNTPCPFGGKAYQCARKMAPRLAEDIRKRTRASGTANHVLGDLVDVSARGDAPQPVDKPVPEGLESLVGTWEFLNDRSYTLVLDGESLQFKEGDISGKLLSEGPWMQGELTKGDAAVGSMRLRPLEDSDGRVYVLSQMLHPGRASYSDTHLGRLPEQKIWRSCRSEF